MVGFSGSTLRSPHRPVFAHHPASARSPSSRESSLGVTRESLNRVALVALRATCALALAKSLGELLSECRIHHSSI